MRQFIPALILTWGCFSHGYPVYAQGTDLAGRAETQLLSGTQVVYRMALGEGALNKNLMVQSFADGATAHNNNPFGRDAHSDDTPPGADVRFILSARQVTDGTLSVQADIQSWTGESRTRMYEFPEAVFSPYENDDPKVIRTRL